MSLMFNEKEVVPKLNKDLKAVYLGNKLIYKSSTQVLLASIDSDAILVSKDGLNYERKTVTFSTGSAKMFDGFGTINGKIWTVNENGIYTTEDLVNYTLLIASPSKNVSNIRKNNVANIDSQFVEIYNSSSDGAWYFNYTNKLGTSWGSSTLIQRASSALSSTPEFVPYKLITFNNKFLLLGNTGIIHLDVDASTRIKKCNFTLLDGSTFTTLDQTTANLTYHAYDGTIYNNKLYVVMHKNATDYRYSIFESIDGINYSEICKIPATTNTQWAKGISGLMIKNNAITFLGCTSSTSAELCKSLDLGNTWSNLTFPTLSSASYSSTDLLKFNDMLIYNGTATSSKISNDIRSQNILISSDDGTTWSKASSGGNWGTPSSFVCLETELNI